MSNNLIFTSDIINFAINENERYKFLNDKLPGVIKFMFSYVDSLLSNIAAFNLLLLSLYIDLIGFPNVRIYKIIMKILTSFLIDPKAGLCIYNLKLQNYCEKNNSFLSLERSGQFGLSKTINLFIYLLFLYFSVILGYIIKDSLIFIYSYIINATNN